jgi:hypothetical protein
VHPEAWSSHEITYNAVPFAWILLVFLHPCSVAHPVYCECSSSYGLASLGFLAELCLVIVKQTAAKYAVPCQINMSLSRETAASMLPI